MTQVNLLPSDVRERQHTRRLTVAVAAAVGAVLALLFFVLLLQAGRLADANRRLAAQEQVNSGIRQRIGELQAFAELKQSVADRRALVAEAQASEVLWSGVLADISKIIPGQMWLTGMSATLTPPAAPAAQPGPATPPGSTPPAALVGSIQFDGVALNHPTVAQWLRRLEQVTGWVNPWLGTASKSQDGSGQIQFSATLDMTAEATVQRGRR
ncbi:MAG: PilN domain-containing protein [Actinomycetota bacterium]